MGEWCWRVEKALKERPCSSPPEASGGGTCGQGELGAVDVTK